MYEQREQREGGHREVHRRVDAHRRGEETGGVCDAGRDERSVGIDDRRDEGEEVEADGGELLHWGEGLQGDLWDKHVGAIYRERVTDFAVVAIITAVDLSVRSQGK